MKQADQIKMVSLFFVSVVSCGSHVAGLLLLLDDKYV